MSWNNESKKGLYTKIIKKTVSYIVLKTLKFDMPLTFKIFSWPYMFYMQDYILI